MARFKAQHSRFGIRSTAFTGITTCIFLVAMGVLAPVGYDDNAPCLLDRQSVAMASCSPTSSHRTLSDLEKLENEARHGDSEAQFQLGVTLFSQRDFTNAIKWYTLAAKNGQRDAQFRLGLLTYFGGAIPRDYIAAVNWFAMAAQNGLDDAAYYLGVIYYLGEGAPNDPKAAYYWFTKWQNSTTSPQNKDVAMQILNQLEAELPPVETEAIRNAALAS
ncbi:tetratricopeptide repeat protein [Desulfovibrio inopinatus]|uniref:tetratricopeptide repeat protein n=1 Tax=Desulfovibrio inopinatus TaxID=102109 RepID=UPI0004266CCB|nr:tetratricopeptide repeat protein [Desulfovibrio inopinatus]